MRTFLLPRCLRAVFVIFLTFASTQLIYSQDDKRTALELVQNNLNNLGLSKSDVDNLYVSDMHTDKLSGILMVYLQQQYKTINVHNAIYSIAFKNGKVVSANSSFIKRIQLKANNETPVVSPAAAVNISAQHLNLPAVASVRQKRVINVGKSVEFEKSNISKTDIPVNLVWVAVGDSLIKLVWEVRIGPVNTADVWNVHVDAAKGVVLQKENLTKYDNWNSPSRKYEPGGNQINVRKRPLYEDNITPAINNEKKSLLAVPLTQNSSYLVFPYPFESPLYTGGAQTEVTNPWLMAGTNNPAITYGWHFDGTDNYAYTRGNNVFAQGDRDGNDTTPGVAGTSSTPFPNLKFSYPLNSKQQPGVDTNLQAAATNLFYWNNIMHDISYQYGFDEAAGNFQKANLGRGGLENDFVYADAQDGIGSDNANFYTPPDGESGRMQMFLFHPTPQTAINAPASIAGTVTSVEGDISLNNLLADKKPVTGNVRYYNDDSLGTSHLGCGIARNTSVLNGNVALIDRGTCNFIVKVKNAQNAGAIAVILVNNVPGAPFPWGSTPYDNTIIIPAVMVSQSDGNRIKAAMQTADVNITLSTVTPYLDGDLDNGVIAHEYGHGISNRLTGGPANSSCLQNAEQMGEGWSDFYALMVTTNWKTAQLSDGLKSRPLGNYVIGQSLTDDGIRTYPYSTNLAINPWTYKGVATTGGEEHDMGEIWCAALWDMTWAIINNDGIINPNLYDAQGAGGNSIAMKLVTLGLKLQPCSPGFLDGRDAILKADTILYGGKYSCVIWKAFARRGMGVKAKQGSSDSFTDQVENFDIPANAIITKSVNKGTFSRGDLLNYTLAVQCQCAPLSGLTIKDTLPASLDYVSGGNINGKEITISPIQLNAQQLSIYNISVKANTTYSPPDTLLFEPVLSATIDATKWSRARLIGNAQWNTDPNIYYSPRYSFAAPDSANKTDLTLTTTKSYYLTPGKLSKLSFLHAFSAEPEWDGGVVELSINSGANWLDAGPYMTSNGYTGVINQITNSSIAGRPAFTGLSSSWIQTVIDLSTFAGDSIKFRFRFCSDEFVGDQGWYVDDIKFITEAGVLNSASLYKDTALLSQDFVTTTMISPAEAPLPVTLTTFNVIKQTDNALINWKTSNEINASRYEVERSVDGINFETIGTVSVAGLSNGDKNYQFTDTDPVVGTNYYRLKQIDQDGKFVYSVIKTIVFDDITLKIILKPNPSDGVFTVNLPASRDVIQLSVFDSKGILVYKSKLNGGSQLINLSKASKGVYLLNFTLKDKTVIKKIIIQ